MRTGERGKGWVIPEQNAGQRRWAGAVCGWVCRCGRCRPLGESTAVHLLTRFVNALNGFRVPSRFSLCMILHYTLLDNLPEYRAFRGDSGHWSVCGSQDSRCARYQGWDTSKGRPECLPITSQSLRHTSRPTHRVSTCVYAQVKFHIPRGRHGAVHTRTVSRANSRHPSEAATEAVVGSTLVVTTHLDPGASTAALCAERQLTNQPPPPAAE